MTFGVCMSVRRLAVRIRFDSTLVLVMVRSFFKAFCFMRAGVLVIAHLLLRETASD